MGTVQRDDQIQIHRDDHQDVRAFIRLDIAGAIAASVLILVVNLVAIQNNGIWLTYPLLAVLILCLFAAQSSLHSGNLVAALTLVAAGNWIISLGIPVLLPFLWPVMALTAVMPLVLASPHLVKAHVMQGVGATASVVAVVAAIGLINDDGGVIEDIDDTLELVVVVGSLAAVVAPIGVIAWLHNQRQRDHVQSLETLNDVLRTSEVRLAASRDRVVHAGDAERRRIERDLHDGAQQHLVALGVRLRLLESQLPAVDPHRQEITTVIGDLDTAIQDIRDLAHGIYPPLLQTRGISAALAAVVRRSALNATTTIDDVDRLGEPIESALYFVALESLANITKHAPDASVVVNLGTDAEVIELVIADDGPGFDPTAPSMSHGLHNLHDRIEVVGGTLEIVSRPGSGTTIRAMVPHRASQLADNITDS